jgi:hypothetical protein
MAGTLSPEILLRLANRATQRDGPSTRKLMSRHVILDAQDDSTFADLLNARLPAGEIDHLQTVMAKQQDLETSLEPVPDIHIQRTVMIAIINNEQWLRNELVCATKWKWLQPKETHLPSTQDDRMRIRSPDFSISFKAISLTRAEDGSDPITPDRNLKGCMSPIHEHEDHCFPFFFYTEIGGQNRSDHEQFKIANQDSASQALKNMHYCMKKAGKEEDFLQKVRAFSVVFYAGDLYVRVHRGVKVLQDRSTVSFQYKELLPESATKRDAYLWIWRILTDYAPNVLCPILKETFGEVLLRREDGI